MKAKLKLLAAVASVLLVGTTMAGDTSEVTKSKLDREMAMNSTLDVNGTVADKTGVNLARNNLKDEQPEPEADDVSSTKSMEVIVKYALIGAVVLIPLILLPILFLFARGTTTEVATAVKEEPNELNFLRIDCKLMPTVPGADPFLADQTVWSNEQGTVVQLDEKTKQPFYHLPAGKALISIRSGQLYDPICGLLFNPVPKTTFDPVTGQLVKTDTAESSVAKQPNLVYDIDTKQVYERTLALTHRDNQWTLARGPVQADQQSIRRARPEELPRNLQPNYAALLTGMKKPTASEVLAAAAPPKLANSLVLSKLDFTKLQPSDSQTTPRTVDSAMKEAIASQKTVFKDTSSSLV